MMGDNKKQHKKEKLDHIWIKQLERMGAANEAARRKHLRSLTIEAAIEEFEKLCREVHQLHGGSSENRSHPVGLIKYIRDHNA